MNPSQENQEKGGVFKIRRRIDCSAGGVSNGGSSRPIYVHAEATVEDLRKKVIGSCFVVNFFALSMEKALGSLWIGDGSESHWGVKVLHKLFKSLPKTCLSAHFVVKSHARLQQSLKNLETMTRAAISVCKSEMFVTRGLTVLNVMKSSAELTAERFQPH